MSRQTATFEPAIEPPAALGDDTLAFAFHRRHLLVHAAGGDTRVPTLGDLASLAGVDVVRRQYLGALGGRHVLSVELAAGTEAPGGMALRGLRGLFGQVPEHHFWLAARAIQIVDWDRDHQFCSRCGEATEPRPGERAKRCPRCALVSYPRLSPAVIVLVRRGDTILLARSPHFPPGMYSTLAGFVEPGETLEQTVVREIREEVAIEVADIRYFGSQPWPFPNSLMVGFTASWAGGEIALDDAHDRTEDGLGEIEDAGWFSAQRLPAIPPRISIARALIDDFLARR